VLSTDQTGLILRATDELRILVAKSMNEVFKTIVPLIYTLKRRFILRRKNAVKPEPAPEANIEA